MEYYLKSQRKESKMGLATGDKYCEICGSANCFTNHVEPGQVWTIPGTDDDKLDRIIRLLEKILVVLEHE